MKRFMNDAASMVSESLSGFVAAHDSLVIFGKDRKFVRRRNLTPGKVAVISGGGAGHEPMHVGFVGQGMLDAACTGHMFTSPTPDQIAAAIEETDTGAGCLLIVKNYDGDVMNFEMAAERAGGRHEIEMVIVRDDSASADSGRRGIAGTLVVEKVVGAAAESGMKLADLAALGRQVCARTRTIGVALSGVDLPDTRRASFRLGEDEMEVGVGIHGEPGRSREKFTTADTIAGLLCAAILADQEAKAMDSALLFVNGFGGTPTLELYLLYHAARSVLERAGVSVSRSLVGTFVTSLDMSGVSITLSNFDENLLRHWDAGAITPALRTG